MPSCLSLGPRAGQGGLAWCDVNSSPRVRPRRYGLGLECGEGLEQPPALPQHWVSPAL